MPSTTVFGIDVHAEEPVTLLGRAATEPTGRRLQMAWGNQRRGASEEQELGELLCDERQPNGEVSFQIARAHEDDEEGYLFWGPTYGLHRLSADASRLHSYFSEDDGHEWQRLLVAQVLPFAALLHGLEVFHASAIVLDGQAIAMIGPSGAGKTSLALELCRRGTGFLADDVLALEVCGERLLAHPGTPVAGVDRGEARRLRQSERFREPDVLWENTRELLVGMRPVTMPAPLGALLFLDRCMDGPPDPRFEAVTDPRLLLSATFNFVHSSPERLVRLLEVSSLAAAQRVQRIVVGPEVDVEQLGQAVLRYMGAGIR